ncbi:MAG: PDZ domain-containing protein [Acidobacteria bacterium]|nr:PDZ domain-containing protein [Acidobacteriota bacterium]
MLLLGLIAGCCLAGLVVDASPALAQQELTIIQGKKKVWPAPSDQQWFWHEPNAQLPPDQVVALFKRSHPACLTPENYNAVLLANTVEVKLDRKKPKKDELRFHTIWYQKNGDGEGKTTYKLKLEPITRLELWYVPDVDEMLPRNRTLHWCVKVYAGSVYVFCFDAESAARDFMDAMASVLAATGRKLTIPSYGLYVTNLTAEQAEDLGQTRVEYILVTSVAIDGPADKAGIRALDIIQQINGIPMRNMSQFEALNNPPGSKFPVVLLRRAEIPGQDPKQYTWEQKTLELVAHTAGGE